MINLELLDRSLIRSVRQSQAMIKEKFRCKEAISDEISRQFKECVPTLCDGDSLNKLIDFSKEINQWINNNLEVINRYFGPQMLSPHPNMINKRQPHLIEAIFGTLIRCELLAKYLPLVKSFDVGCILGGSLSYGKFFNIRQPIEGMDSEEPASDIDLILIVDFQQVNEFINNLLNNPTQISDPRLKDIIHGLAPLIGISKQEVEQNNLNCSQVVISKKFFVEGIFEVGNIFAPLKDKHSFFLSIHLISHAAFSMITNPLTIDLYKEEYDEKRKPTLVDIRFDSSLPNIMLYNTMEGIMVPEHLSIVEKQDKIVRFGTNESTIQICKIPIYFFWEDRFISGSYQNLISPGFEILFNDSQNFISNKTEDFRNYLIKECFREMSIFIDSDISLSKLHPRYLNFLKSVSDKLDKLTERRMTKDKTFVELSYNKKDQLEKRKKFHSKYSGSFSLYQKIIDKIIPLKMSGILDLGCGSGDLFNLLKISGFSGTMVGIDLVPIWERIPNRPPGTFFVGDLVELDKILADNNVNIKIPLITAIHVLYHINNLPLLFEHIINTLENNGLFMATTNSNQSFSVMQHLMRKVLLSYELGTFTKYQYNMFCTENSIDFMREYFKDIEHLTIETEILVPNYHDVVEYLVSNFDNYEIPHDSELRENISNDLLRELRNMFNGNPFIDKKIASFTIGLNPIK